jgi:hypothetical protein
MRISLFFRPDQTWHWVLLASYTSICRVCSSLNVRHLCGACPSRSKQNPTCSSQHTMTVARSRSCAKGRSCYILISIYLREILVRENTTERGKGAKQEAPHLSRFGQPTSSFFFLKRKKSFCLILI